MLIYFGIVALMSPNLEEFLIYFNEYMMVTPLFEGYAEVVLFIAGAIIFLIYNSYVMSKSEVHITAVVAILFRVISALFFAADVAEKYPAGKTLMIQAVAIRSFVDAFLYIPGMIMYTKMVPHNIEGMMIGFAWGLIKFNADVLGRLIAVGLNLKFMVMGEVKMVGEAGPIVEAINTATAEAVNMANTAAEAVTGEQAVAEEVPPFMNLYKMYLIQAGMVFFPIFFVCMLAKRKRVEEVQMVLHHRHHHSLQHPEEKSIRLSEALERIRISQATRLTVNNDFAQFS